MHVGFGEALVGHLALVAVRAGFVLPDIPGLEPADQHLAARVDQQARAAAVQVLQRRAHRLQPGLHAVGADPLGQHAEPRRPAHQQVPGGVLVRRLAGALFARHVTPGAFHVVVRKAAVQKLGQAAAEHLRHQPLVREMQLGQDAPVEGCLELGDHGRTLEALVQPDPQRHARFRRQRFLRHVDAAVEFALPHRVAHPQVGDLVVDQPVHHVAAPGQPHRGDLAGVVLGRKLGQVFRARLAIARLAEELHVDCAAAGRQVRRQHLGHAPPLGLVEEHAKGPVVLVGRVEIAVDLSPPAHFRGVPLEMGRTGKPVDPADAGGQHQFRHRVGFVQHDVGGLDPAHAGDHVIAEGHEHRLELDRAEFVFDLHHEPRRVAASARPSGRVDGLGIDLLETRDRGRPQLAVGLAQVVDAVAPPAVDHRPRHFQRPPHPLAVQRGGLGAAHRPHDRAHVGVRPVEGPGDRAGEIVGVQRRKAVASAGLPG